MYRRCVKHNTSATFALAALPILLVWLIFLLRANSIFFPVFYSLIAIVAANYVVSLCPNQLLIRAVKILDEQCDPYPLLEELRFLMPYAQSGIYRQVLLINESMAFGYIGETGRALALLQSINIDQYPGMPIMMKCVYYNNLALYHLYHGDFEKADIWQQKAAEIYRGLKKNKKTQPLEQAIRTTAAEIACFKKDYDGARAIFGTVADTSMRSAVDNALLLARIDIGQTRYDEARQKLLFVMERGNRLVNVKIAEELLAALPA